ncbi:putative inorganic phosphate cotransporter [Trichonephila clavipes]|nr:putative inorganic phosphate cotransporter [Trichonephila clavipes]
MLRTSQKNLLPAQIGDTVRIQVPDVNRGHTDNRNLLAVVIGIEDSDFYKLANENGTATACYECLDGQVVSKKRKRYLSAFIYCGYPMGAFFASIVSGALCDMEFMGGWPLVFYTFGLLGVFVGLLLVFFFVEKPEDDPKISEFELQHILQNQDNTSTISRPPTPWSQMLLSIPTYALVVALFGQYWMAFYFLSVHPTYLGTILNIPIKENGILSSGPYLVQALTGFCACWLAFWLTRNKHFNVNSLRKGANTLSCLIFTVGIIGVYFSGCDRTLNEIFLFIATGSVGFGFAGSLITAVDMSPTFCV